MKKIEAIVRPEKYEDVKDALNAINIQGITVYEVMGCGAQKGWTEVVRGNEIDINLLPKIKFEVVVSTDALAEKTIAAIVDAAGTQAQGDGKIFVYDLSDVVRIRTGERGADAI